MNLKNVLAGAAGLFVISQSALAATIDVNYLGSASFGGAGVGYLAGSVFPSPVAGSAASVLIGGDSFGTSNHGYDFSATGKFNTWCVDLTHWMYNSSATVTYNVFSSSDIVTTQALGAGRVSQLIGLANEVYAGVDTQVESAAFQLAVWAITFGNADSNGLYHIANNSAGFRVESGAAAAVSMANGWLDKLDVAGTAITGNYKLSYLNDTDMRISTQDMIVFSAAPEIDLRRVPEPASLALLGLGLLGLGLSRRNRVRAAQR